MKYFIPFLIGAILVLIWVFGRPTELPTVIVITPTAPAPTVTVGATSEPTSVPTLPNIPIPITNGTIGVIDTKLENGFLNLRSCNSIYCSVIISLEEDTHLCIAKSTISQQWVFAEITTSNLAGWVNSYYLSFPEEEISCVSSYDSIP